MSCWMSDEARVVSWLRYCGRRHFTRPLQLVIAQNTVGIAKIPCYRTISSGKVEWTSSFVNLMQLHGSAEMTEQEGSVP